MNYAASPDVQTFTGDVQRALADVRQLQEQSRPVFPALVKIVADLRSLRATIRDQISLVDTKSEPIPESVVELLANSQETLRCMYRKSRELPLLMGTFPAWHSKRLFREMETLRWAILEHNADMEGASPQVLKTPDEIDKFFSSL